jgi:hypothetical protein
MRPSSFRHRLMAYDRSKARLCDPDNRLSSILPHSLAPTLQILGSPCSVTVSSSSLPRLTIPFSLSTSSLECLLFVGHPIQVACVPLMKISLLPRVPIPSSPRGRTSGQDLPLIRSLSGVGPCVFHNAITLYPFSTYTHRPKGAWAFHQHLTSSTLPWRLTTLFTVKWNPSAWVFPPTFHSPRNRH